MRFRRLNATELAPLADEFIKFIALNGIDAGTWDKIKRTKPDEVEAYIADFSDMVLLRSLKNIKTIEFCSAQTRRVFRFDTTQAKMLQLYSTQPETTNLAELSFAQVLSSEAHLAHISVYQLEKTYTADRREDEIFALLQSGATIADDAVFEQLQQLL